MSVNSNSGGKVYRQGITIILLVLIYIFLSSLPSPEGLSIAGQKALALMTVAVLSWVLEVVPLAVSALFFFILQPILGIATFDEAINGFAQPIFFFAIGSFLIANALTQSGISERISLKMALISKGNPEKMLFIFMFSSAIMSSFLADVPVVAVMFPIGLAILKGSGCTPKKSNFGKALMIGLGLSALIGGIGTPSGSSANILTMDLLNNMAGIQITYLQWTLIGFPVVLFLIPIVWKVLCIVFPPEIDTLTGLDEVQSRYNALHKLTKKEIKFLIITVILLFFWIKGILPIPITSLLFGILFFFPGIDVLTWENSRNKIGWEVIILTSVCASLGMTIWKTEAASWIGSILSNMVSGLPAIAVLFIICLFVGFIHLLIPINPALVSIMIPIAISIAEDMGINPSFFVIPIGFMISCACLLPLDAVTLIPYAGGYFKMQDMLKPGVFVLVFWVVLVVVAMYTIAHPLGLT
ncbi:SLC13 family permease [Peptococcus simiae]|uniref:SLC13 family permease n=1 Tax=Peptococcus simiae TaxID=1643805 RepID=UPI003980A064